MDNLDILESKLIKVYPNCRLGEEVEIGEFSVLGKASRLKGSNSEYASVYLGGKSEVTRIGSRTCIGTHVLIEEGVDIGEDCIVESHSVIGAGVNLGNNTIIVSSTKVLGRVQIGNGCVVGGVVSENSVIGDYCRVFGNLIHKQCSPHLSWDNNIESAPKLASSVFVGQSANLIGPVVIGEHVFVCAGAIVTKNIPPNSVVKGVNEIIPISNWKGMLSQSPFLKG